MEILSGQCLLVFFNWFLFFPASLRIWVEAIYKPLESTALFTVNQASTRARILCAGCEASPLSKSPTERKYIFSLGSINGTDQLILFIGRLSQML